MKRARPPHRTQGSNGRLKPSTPRKKRRPALEAPPVAAGKRPLFPSALPVLAGALLVLAVLWIPFAPFVTPKPSRLWRGYHTVLVRAGGPADSLIPDALARLGPGIICERTATVDFYDFSSSVRFPYAGLRERLDPLDPRRDPYIDRMAGYFTVTSGEAEQHALYIPARSTSLRLYLSLWSMLGPPARSAWRLVDFDPVEKLISVAALIAFAVLMTRGTRRRGRWPPAPALVSLLWVPAIIAGGPSMLALSFCLLAFCLPLLRTRLASAGKSWTDLRRSRGPLLRYLGIGAISLLVFFLVNGRSLVMLLQPLAPFLCSLLVVLVAPLVRQAADEWRRLLVFAAVPLARNGREPGKGGQRALSLALFSIAIVVLIPLSRGGAFPAPIALAGAHEFSWDAVVRLRQGSKADRLPDFSDLVAHEAYQQTLGFGRKWREPAPDERVYRQEYLVNPFTGVVRARLRTVKVFDSTWLASVRAHPASASLDALLLSQGRPVEAAVRGPARTLAGELPFTALAFCALLLLLGRDLRLGLLIRGNLWRLNGEARRDQIP